MSWDEVADLSEKDKRFIAACHAIQGQFASFNDMNWNRFHANRKESIETIAIVAVEQADALIAVLERK